MKLDARPRRAADQVRLIRDLSPAGRAIALFLAVCVSAPIVVAFLRLAGVVGSAPRFTAFGDSAYLALRSRDVLSGPFPLVGSQSSAETAVNIMQPGPAQFIAQAPWTALLGGDLGPLMFAAVASLLAVVGSVWVTLRRFGLLGAAAAALIVVAIEAQLGGAALVDSISSTHGQLPAFFAVLLCVMVLVGDLRLFPLAVVVSSYLLQTHLSFVGYGIVLMPLLIVALVAGARRMHRGEAKWFLPWAVTGVLLGFVMWAPPLIDQVFDTGNLAKVLSAGSGETSAEALTRTGSELVSGLASVFGPVPALLTPPDRLLGLWSFDRSAIETIVGLAIGACAAVAAAAGIVIGRRRTRRGAELGDGDGDGDGRDSALVAARCLVAAAAVLAAGVALALIGVLFASRLRGFAIVKPNNNRWMVIAGAVTWLGALLTAGASQLGAQRMRGVAERHPNRARLAGRLGAGAVAIALLGYSAAVIVRPLEPSVADPWLGASQPLADAVSDAWGGRGPVRFRSVGPVSAGGLQPALMLDLEEGGATTLTVGGLEALRAGYGAHRWAANDDPPYVLLQDGDVATPQAGELIDVVAARPTAGDGSERSARVRACLDRATRAGAATTLTPGGRRVVADPQRAGDDPEDQLLAAGLRDPRLLFLTGLSSVAVERGYLEPIDVEGCGEEELDDLAGELTLSAWLVS